MARPLRQSTPVNSDNPFKLPPSLTPEVPMCLKMPSAPPSPQIISSGASPSCCQQRGSKEKLPPPRPTQKPSYLLFAPNSGLVTPSSSSLRISNIAANRSDSKPPWCNLSEQGTPRIPDYLTKHTTPIPPALPMRTMMDPSCDPEDTDISDSSFVAGGAIAEANAAAQALSINGLEPLPYRSSSDVDNSSDDTSILSRRENARGTREAAIELYQGIRNNFLSVEDTLMVIKRLQKDVDAGIKRSYVDGYPVQEVVKSAPVLKVGLSFLDGSNTAKVNRMEQSSMMNREPEQMSAEWRVNTAGQLLSEFEVRQDLSVLVKDQTKRIARRARKRATENRPRLSSSESLSRADWPVAPNQYDSRQLSDAAVTIDSERVLIVNDLHGRSGEFDLESTLIEVDGPSLLNLLVSYRWLIERVGHSPNFDETRDILETMMEGVRRLCSRSPILFRMSTRNRIIRSKNTRYGTNHGRQFTTITTSRGIQEIIGHSASYFNSLDSDSEAQQFIRPRFLQMLVVLLSLLNDDDLLELQDFLEHTYRLKADRQSLELLILRVIPLSSINPKVFITSLIPTYEGYSPHTEMEDVEVLKHCWDTFIQQIIKKDYILPGTVENLGRPQLSWVTDWPTHGFKDSSVFEHLQYGGELRTINQIPRFDNLLNPEKSAAELTIVATNNQKYLIRAVDYSSIILLNPNTYSIKEVGSDGRRYDLVIEETWLNRSTNKAVSEMNRLIREINAFLAPNAIKRSNSIMQKFSIKTFRGSDIVRMRECTYSGRLTKHEAMINNDILAVAYKREGQKVTISDTLNLMGQDNREIEGLAKYYTERLQSHSREMDRSSITSIIDRLAIIQQYVNQAEDMRKLVSGGEHLSDEPITKVLVAANNRSQPSEVWYQYRARASDNGNLRVKGMCSTIKEFKWLSESIIEVSLTDDRNGEKYIVSPIEQVEPRKRDDQVQENDLAILAGQYMIIAERNDGENSGFFCTNFLKITSVEEPTRSDRGKKRRQILTAQRSQPQRLGGSITLLL